MTTATVRPNITRCVLVHYEASTDLIEIVAKPSNADLALVRGGRIVETVTGWEPYTHLVKTEIDEQGMDCPTYWLATVAE